MLAEIDESCGEMVEELFNLYKGKIFSGRNIGQNYSVLLLFLINV